MNINFDNLNLNFKTIFIKIINNNKVARGFFLHFIKTINDLFIKIIKSIKNIKNINLDFKFIKIIKKTFVFRYQFYLRNYKLSHFL